MKLISIFMAVVFTFVLGFSTLPGDANAKSNTKEVTAEKSTKKTDKKKSTTQAKKGKKSIPKNININSADKDTLMLLPGVGPKTADAITKYRKTNGKFKSVDELKNVKGIGDKTFAKLKPYLKKI